jgi:predicted transcriptional regulator
MAGDKKKLTVSLSSEIVDVLRDLASSNDSTMTEELKRAISDRKFFSDRKAEGSRILLENDAERTYVEFR